MCCCAALGVVGECTPTRIWARAVLVDGQKQRPGQVPSRCCPLCNSRARCSMGTPSSPGQTWAAGQAMKCEEGRLFTVPWRDKQAGGAG